MRRKLEIGNMEWSIRGDHVYIKGWYPYGGEVLHEPEIIQLKAFLDKFSERVAESRAEIQARSSDVDALFNVILIFIKELKRIGDERDITNDPERALIFCEGLLAGALTQMVEVIDSVPEFHDRMKEIIKQVDFDGESKA